MLCRIRRVDYHNVHYIGLGCRWMVVLQYMTLRWFMVEWHARTSYSNPCLCSPCVHVHRSTPLWTCPSPSEAFRGFRCVDVKWSYTMVCICILTISNGASISQWQFLLVCPCPVSMIISDRIVVLIGNVHIRAYRRFSRKHSERWLVYCLFKYVKEGIFDRQFVKIMSM